MTTRKWGPAPPVRPVQTRAAADAWPSVPVTATSSEDMLVRDAQLAEAEARLDDDRAASRHAASEVATWPAGRRRRQVVATLRCPGTARHPLVSVLRVPGHGLLAHPEQGPPKWAVLLDRVPPRARVRVACRCGSGYLPAVTLLDLADAGGNHPFVESVPDAVWAERGSAGWLVTGQPASIAAARRFAKLPAAERGQQVVATLRCPGAAAHPLVTIVAVPDQGPLALPRDQIVPDGAVLLDGADPRARVRVACPCGSGELLVFTLRMTAKRGGDRVFPADTPGARWTDSETAS